METKDKDKKNKPNRPKAPIKDLRARKEDADKVQGGTITYGPES